MELHGYFLFLVRYQNEFGNLIRERNPHHLVKGDLIKLMEWKLTVSFLIQFKLPRRYLAVWPFWKQPTNCLKILGQRGYPQYYFTSYRYPPFCIDNLDGKVFVVSLIEFEQFVEKILKEVCFFWYLKSY